MAWKDIEGFEGLYKISDTGQVMSVRNGIILKQYLNNQGYWSIKLCVHSKKTTFLVHRLVAKAFIPNPDGYPIINHKDENPKNNKVENLEWCTYSYNTMYGTAPQRREAHIDYFKRNRSFDHVLAAKPFMKPVLKIKDGEIIGRYDSIRNAARSENAKTANGHIGDVCTGKRQRAYGYEWRFAE